LEIHDWTLPAVLTIVVVVPLIAILTALHNRALGVKMKAVKTARYPDITFLFTNREYATMFRQFNKELRIKDS